jgi:hypothetical protein
MLREKTRSFEGVAYFVALNSISLKLYSKVSRQIQYMGY